MKYQNVSSMANVSEFTRTDVVDGSTATFRAKTSPYTPAPGVQVQMVSASVRYEKDATYLPCGEVECGAPVRESVEIRFNSIKGNAAVLALNKAELLRLFDEAISAYHLAYGLLPPATADFDSE